MTSGAPLTDEQREMVKALYVSGKTASMIAAALLDHFGVRKSRNAICGVLYRLDIRAGRPKRDKVRAKEKTPEPKPRAAQEARRAPTPPALPRADNAARREPPTAPDAAHTGLLAVRFGQCRSVVGKGRDGLALFCGAPTEPNISWCATCAARFLRTGVAT